MKPRIEFLAEKKLIGMRCRMALANDNTADLWKSFMPRRKEIHSDIGNVLYSIRVYDPMYFRNFDRLNEFEKWAALEVPGFDAIPPGMESFVLGSGLYAIFLHKGSNRDHRTFQYIFETWLPHADYVLDDRPHFDLLGEQYKNNDADSEEELWIPIQCKP